MPINVLILEDEPLKAWALEKMLEELGGYKIIAICQEEEKAIPILEQEDIDLLLIDIRLKGKIDGISFAKTNVPKGLPIVLMTQYEDEKTYRDTLNIPNHAFLVKPFHKFTLDSIIHSLLPSKKTTESLIYVRVGNKREIITPESILWVEANRNYCHIKTQNKEYIVKRSLRLVGENLLLTGLFIYIHKSFIVRIELIKRIDLKNKSVDLGDTLLPLGRNFIKSLKEKLQSLG